MKKRFRMTGWDKEIVSGLISHKEPSKAKGIVERYKELRKDGNDPESVIDTMSGMTMDTRWIYWLPSARKQLKKVL